MKAAPFSYARPATLDEALAELADGEAKVLAGGQSLVPVLAMRLARPATLVDLAAIDELAVLRRNRAGLDGVLEVGTMVRQRTLEHSTDVGTVPLLARALPWVGHRELRSRGTVGGSLAHADPAAELPAVACCLDAEIDISGPDGARTVPAREFFSGAMTTALEPSDVLTRVRFPVARKGEGFGFAEVARRHGDFALAGVAVRAGEDGAVLTAFGVSDRPVTRDVTHLLDGGSWDDLTGEIVDTAGDAHGSPGYRRQLLAALGARELARAHQEAARSGDSR